MESSFLFRVAQICQALLAKPLDCLDYFYPLHLMANFYTPKCQVTHPHFLIVSAFPYCQVSLSSFLQVLRSLCGLTTVLRILTFPVRFSCQSLTLTKVCAPERQHLRLFSLETNLQRKRLTCSCNLRPILWGALGLKRLSLELSQIETRDRPCCLLYMFCPYPYTPRPLPQPPREINLQ